MQSLYIYILDTSNIYMYVVLQNLLKFYNQRVSICTICMYKLGEFFRISAPTPRITGTKMPRIIRGPETDVAGVRSGV